MSFVRREFYTKDKNIQRYLDRLMSHGIVELPPKIAQDIGRTRVIRDIREIDRKDPFILIANDQKYHKSFIKIRLPMKIVKEGDRYRFLL
jgi:hypothetical protein